MNKQITLTYTGGFPFTQDTLKWMQESYTDAFKAIAQLVGENGILYGCENVSGTVGNGWVVINGELMPLIGGTIGGSTMMAVQTTAGTAQTFDDGSTHDVYFTKALVFSVSGTIDYNNLIRVPSLINIWKPGDLRQTVVDATYEAANFDVNGYGLNRERGWRIWSKATPAAAGKVLVNKDPADVDFDTVGKNGGAKTHTLTQAQLPSIPGKGMVRTTGNDTATAFDNSAGEMDAKTMQSWPGADQPHNNLQPYYVVLTLIKL